jgi:hypothetical protein
MATRNAFIEKLVEAYSTKRYDLHYALVKAVEDANQQRIKDYTSTPEWVKFMDLAKKVLGPKKADLINIKDMLRYRGDTDELSKMIGLEEVPDRYVNRRLDTLILGALTTTKIKFWDGLYPPVSAYLDAIETATTNEEIDAAILALVEAL